MFNPRGAKELYDGRVPSQTHTRLQSIRAGQCGRQAIGLVGQLRPVSHQDRSDLAGSPSDVSNNAGKVLGAEKSQLLPMV